MLSERLGVMSMRHENPGTIEAFFTHFATLPRMDVRLRSRETPHRCSTFLCKHVVRASMRPSLNHASFALNNTLARGQHYHLFTLCKQHCSHFCNYRTTIMAIATTNSTSTTVPALPTDVDARMAFDLCVTPSHHRGPSLTPFLVLRHHRNNSTLSVTGPARATSSRGSSASMVPSSCSTYTASLPRR